MFQEPENTPKICLVKPVIPEKLFALVWVGRIC